MCSIARSTSLLLVMLTIGCATSAPMVPSLRSPVAQRRAAVMVEVYCTQTDIFETSKEHPDPLRTTFAWRPKRIASGGLVSDETVLTNAHVTTCPVIPVVYVTLSNGVRRMMDVVREDIKKDLALLRTHAAEPFWHGVAPPVLGVFEYMADDAVNCVEVAFPHRARRCGTAVTPTRLAFESEEGNSGSFVYDSQGHLVGLVARSYVATRRGSGAIYNHARIVIPDQGWIK